MTTRARTTKPAPKRSSAASSKAAPKRASTRKAAPRKQAARQPVAPPSQLPRILSGIIPIPLGVFMALLLWFGLDGSAAGSRLADGSYVAFGIFALLLPVILIGVGALILQTNVPATLRRRLAGVPLVLLALLLAISNDRTTGRAAEESGGYVGGSLHGLLGSAVGDAGMLVAVALFAVVGMILIAGQTSVGLWRAFIETLVATYYEVGDRRHDASTRRELRREQEEHELRLDQQEAARARGERIRYDDVATFTLADPLQDAVFSDPVRDLSFPELAPAIPDLAPAFSDLAHQDWPDLAAEEELEPAAAEPWQTEPVAETPESVLDPYGASGAPTIDLSPVPVQRPLHVGYRLPDPSVLKRSQEARVEQAALDRMGRTLVEALGSFGVESRIIGTVSGPRVTRYEIQLAPGTKVGRVSALKDDLAYALATTDIRILAPIPGKQAVGVEVPNLTPNLVTLGDIQGRFPAGCSPLTVWLGKDISGNHVHADLAKMPHILIAGTTGSGKSGSLNAMLVSILLNASPDEVKMILIDPKRVELNHYEAIPHLMTPVVTNMKSAAAALMNVVGEMERRYEKLGAARSRNIVEFNKARVENGRVEDVLPYVLVVIDELADLMMVSPAEVEDCIIRLAQKSRAVGIHLVLATQRPSVDVITGMIKANVPSRIAFAVSSMTDSRVILDTPGAESLLGQGDMLYRPIGTSRIQRIQGAYVGEEEVGLVVEQCRNQAEPEFEEGFLELPQIVASASGPGSGDSTDPDADPLLEDALRVVCNHETASVSLLQRRLRVGYTRAGRLVDMLERRGAISGYEGSKPRQVLVTEADIPRIMAGGSASAALVAAGPPADDPPWSAADTSA